MPTPKRRTAPATRQVIFRLPESDYAPLEAIAIRARIGVNELARRITRRRYNRVVIEVVRRHDPALIAQLRALGINLNQIARRMHQSDRLPRNLEPLCDEIRRVMFEAIESDVDQ